MKWTYLEFKNTRLTLAPSPFIPVIKTAILEVTVWKNIALIFPTPKEAINISSSGRGQEKQ